MVERRSPILARSAAHDAAVPEFLEKESPGQDANSADDTLPGLVADHEREPGAVGLAEERE